MERILEDWAVDCLPGSVLDLPARVLGAGANGPGPLRQPCRGQAGHLQRGPELSETGWGP